MKKLLKLVGRSHLAEDQGIEDGENVAAIGEHAFHHAVVHRIAVGEALPALHHMTWHIDIRAQLLQRVAPQK